jgi:hypothetical protein
VLPRILRRPARFFTKVFDGEITFRALPSRSALPGIFAATALYGSIAGGQFNGAVGA